jgi:hypothetical protein
MYLFPRNTSNHFKPRLFRLHNPSRRKPPRKAVDVFPQIITHIKIQGFPASPPPKSTFSADGKSPESPVFRPFFRRLFVFYICHQCHALNMGRVDGVDVCRSFFIVSVRGNMSKAFSTILKTTVRGNMSLYNDI